MTWKTICILFTSQSSFSVTHFQGGRGELGGLKHEEVHIMEEEGTRGGASMMQGWSA